MLPSIYKNDAFNSVWKSSKLRDDFTSQNMLLNEQFKKDLPIIKIVILLNPVKLLCTNNHNFGGKLTLINHQLDIVYFL